MIYGERDYNVQSHLIDVAHLRKEYLQTGVLLAF